MVNFDSPCVESEQSNDIKEKDASMKMLALEIVKEFPEQFPNHVITYVGVQSGGGLCDDAYLFDIMSKQSAANGTAFAVRKLDQKIVEDAFVKKIKAFGEDVVKVE